MEWDFDCADRVFLKGVVVCPLGMVWRSVSEGCFCLSFRDGLA